MPSRVKKGALPVESEVELDVSKAMAESQRRIMRLRKQRDERLLGVVAECQDELKALAEVKKDDYERKRQKMAGEQVRHVTTLMDSIERRRAIEEEMRKIVDDMCEAMYEVESMIWAGYEGRWEEVANCIRRDVA
ncbi:hypothetical protein GMORB2_5657 [Geosmithia morbida]|uniref:Uncharacterized protein n=1 Tax=Geosmithia morbida TaxID=1094350 RepID=A0A9P4YY80_9HYPO|nr:uncharacterized protein GMORB2_5657 [Geosmithia morbida]KAF4123941.1 hypothetical protein GMORB2_5657 [Geosmithia morbida]